MREHTVSTARPSGRCDAVVGVVEASWYGGVDPAPDALTAPVRQVSDALRAVPVALRRRLFPASVTATARPPRRTLRDRDAAAVARH